jgi:glycosyltransferase involved in cell wall biosynthesis
MNKRKTPLVSIVVTCYNYGRYVIESLDSVKKQTYANLELIIINDGSTDDSDKVIKKWLKENPNTAKKTQYVSQKNQGIVFARNKGLDLAQGEYIIFLDADDVLPDDYIKKSVDFAIKNDADVVYGDFHQFSDDGTVNSKMIFPEFSLETLLAVNVINISSLIKTSAAKKHSFDAHLNHLSHEDWDYFLGLALGGAKIMHLKENYLHYRIKSNSRNVTDIKKYMKTYAHIIDKYAKKYPKQFENIEQNWEYQRERWLQEAQIHAADLTDIIAKKDKLIQQKDQEITKITQSKSHKIGHKITAPYRRLKRLIK